MASTTANESLQAFWKTPQTILITGGGSGIGLSFAQRWAKAGHTVLIAGRRLEQLAKAASETEGLIPIQADVETPEGRVALFTHARTHHPNLTVLVNNAGILNKNPPIYSLAADGFSVNGIELWHKHHQEISINFEGPVQLSMLFAPWFHQRSDTPSAIINVTSGLAYVPAVVLPVYSATKAAMHSYTKSLREQLKHGPCKVIEISPPAVKTDLGGGDLHSYGEPLDEYSDSVFENLSQGKTEFGFRFSAHALEATYDERAVLFERLNASFAASQ
ncbi:MAG: SDR family NAD(P)-dependent oxidoreductase [archaeon]|nr:SDR family NAD(P)-dependent oxidoreductase [archaeon]